MYLARFPANMLAQVTAIALLIAIPYQNASTISIAVAEPQSRALISERRHARYDEALGTSAAYASLEHPTTLQPTYSFEAHRILVVWPKHS